MAQSNGSVAQTNVQFPIESVIEPMAGETAGGRECHFNNKKKRPPARDFAYSKTR